MDERMSEGMTIAGIFFGIDKDEIRNLKEND